MERKKKKRKRKIKKRTEERKEGFPIKDRKEVKKKKKGNSRSMKERGQKFFKARFPLRIILDWQYPTPHEQRGKD